MKKALVTLLSKSFLPGFKAAINSIKANTPDFNLPIVCLNIDLDNDDKSECKKCYGDIIFSPINMPVYAKKPISASALQDSFYKLDFFSIAKNYDHSILFDCDMLFLKSISPLINMSFKKIMMVYHKEYKSFNSGLIVAPQLTNEYDKLINLMKSMPEAHLGDQSVIVEADKQKIIKFGGLDSIWNVTKRQVKLFGYKNYAGLHFVGKKPWQGGEEGYKEIEAIWHQYHQMEL